MATVEQTLDVARSYLGEGPRRFVDWYPAPMGTAWCAIFQSFVQTEVGLPIRFAWVSGMMDFYRGQGRTFAPHEAQPGDIIAFDYDGNGSGSYDHTAIIESVERADDGTPVALIAINGNWTNQVCRVRHALGASGYAGGIAELARPAYDTPPSPGPIPQPQEEDEMKRYLVRGHQGGEVYLADAGLGWKWHIPAGQLANVVWVITQSSGGQIITPPGANTIVVENVAVWVADQSFVDAIPTIS